MHTRPPAPPRARALYCYFSRIFNKVACGIAFSFTRSLTHSSPLPSQICSGRTDPLNREILQSSVKRKGSNCGENCEGSSAENCYRGIATPYHLPCILKYRHRFAASQVLRYNTGIAIRAFLVAWTKKKCILGFLMTNHGLSKLALSNYR